MPEFWFSVHILDEAAASPDTWITLVQFQSLEAKSAEDLRINVLRQMPETIWNRRDKVRWHVDEWQPGENGAQGWTRCYGKKLVLEPMPYDTT